MQRGHWCPFCGAPRAGSLAGAWLMLPSVAKDKTYLPFGTTEKRKACTTVWGAWKGLAMPHLRGSLVKTLHPIQVCRVFMPTGFPGHPHSL